MAESTPPVSAPLASDRIEFSADGRRLIQIDAARSSTSLRAAAAGDMQWEYAPNHHQGLICGTFTGEENRVLTYSAGDGFRVVNAGDGTVLKSFSARESWHVLPGDGTQQTRRPGDWHGS